MAKHDIGVSSTRLIAALRRLGFVIKSVAAGHVVLMYRGRTTHIPRSGFLPTERVRFLVGINGVRWEDLQAALLAGSSWPSGELPAIVVTPRGDAK
jgi:hypothetical protein